MAVFSTQYRIRYTVPTVDGNKEIRNIICGDKYGVQININKIIAKKNEGYEFIGLDERTININYISNIKPDYGWNKIFNF